MTKLPPTCIHSLHRLQFGHVSAINPHLTMNYSLEKYRMQCPKKKNHQQQLPSCHRQIIIAQPHYHANAFKRLPETNFILAFLEKPLLLQIFWKCNCFNKLWKKNEKLNRKQYQKHNQRLGQKYTFEINETQFEVHKKNIQFNRRHATKEKGRKLINESLSIKSRLSMVSLAN